MLTSELTNKGLQLCNSIPEARVFVESRIVSIPIVMLLNESCQITSPLRHSPECRIVNLIDTEACLKPLVNLIEKRSKILKFTRPSCIHRWQGRFLSHYLADENLLKLQQLSRNANAPFVSTYDNSGNFVSSYFASFSYFWLINGHRGDEHGYLVGIKGGGWLRASMYTPVVSVKGELEVHNFAFQLEGLKFVWGDHGSLRESTKLKLKKRRVLSGSGALH